jgi:hypothetical protein
MRRVLTPAVRQEIATDLIAKREFVWCRARLMHALVGAHAQGVLEEVLAEIVGDFESLDAETLADDIGTWLSEHGWEHGEPPPPGELNIFDEEAALPSPHVDPDEAESTHGPSTPT